MTDFTPVGDLLQRFVDDGIEIGAGLSIWHQGEEALCASVGTSNAAGDPWTDGTLVHTYSVGKPMAALAALVAVARGQLTLDEPLADVWHAYGVRGKSSTTLRQVLSHTAGQQYFPASDVDLFDTAGLIRTLEEATPTTKPGTAIAEHALTYGHLIDGALAAVGAPSVAETLREIAAGAGWDLYFGVPEADLVRVADLEYLEPDWPSLGNPKAFAYPPGTRDIAILNSDRWRRHSFPAIGLHATASGLAKFYWDLTNDDGPVARAIGTDLLHEYISVQAAGPDQLLKRDVEWTLGFQIDEDDITMGGLGGSAGWYDAELDYSLGFVTRGLADHERVIDLWHATIACLAEPT